MIKVTGPSIKEALRIFNKSIVSIDSAMLKLTSVELKILTKFEFIVDKIDASIWHLPPAHFNEEPELSKHLIMHGWINKEESKKISSTVTRNCRIEFHENGEIFLMKKREKKFTKK